MRWDKFLQHIEKGKPRPFYLFYGDEELLIAEALSKLKRKLVPPAFEDWNCQTFHVDDADPEDVLVAARTLPLFSPWRMVVVKGCQRLEDAAAQRAILSYLLEPCLSTCLVCLMSPLPREREESAKADEGPAKRASPREFLEAFRKQDALVEFSQPWDNELHSWVGRLCNSLGRRIEPEAVKDLIQACDKDLLAINNELIKLDIYLPPQEVISAKAVEEVVFQGLTENLFALSEAIAEKNIREAWALLDRLLLLPPKKAAPGVLLAIIASQFRRIMKAKEMLSHGKNKGVVGNALNVPGRFQDRFFRQVEGFSREELQNNLSRLMECDLTLKSSGMPQKIHLERLIVQLCAQGLP